MLIRTGSAGLLADPLSRPTETTRLGFVPACFLRFSHERIEGTMEHVVVFESVSAKHASCRFGMGMRERPMLQRTVPTPCEKIASDSMRDARSLHVRVSAGRDGFMANERGYERIPKKWTRHAHRSVVDGRGREKRKAFASRAVASMEDARGTRRFDFGPTPWIDDDSKVLTRPFQSHQVKQ